MVTTGVHTSGEVVTTGVQTPGEVVTTGVQTSGEVVTTGVQTSGEVVTTGVVRNLTLNPDVGILETHSCECTFVSRHPCSDE